MLTEPYGKKHYDTVSISGHMRILIIADCYPPSVLSGSKMMHELAREFHRIGHKVTVVMPDRNLSSSKDVSEEDGITVVKVKSGRIKNVNKAIRAVNEMRLNEIVWGNCKRHFIDNPCDYIIFYSPTIFWGKLIHKLKRLWQCKAYMIQRDIFPQWALDVGLLKKNLIYYFFKYIEKIQYDAADIIGIESPGYRSYYIKNGIDKKCKIEVLYNWMSLSQTELPFNNIRKKLKLEDKTVFFYGGNIGIAQELENIIELAEKLSCRSDIYFLLVGNGSESKKLKTTIRSRSLNNISILPGVPQEEYMSMLSEFDIGIISLNRNLKGHNYPGKMLGYMFFSKPIMASVNSENDLISFLENSETGLTSKSGDLELLVENAIQFADNAKLRKSMGLNSKRTLNDQFNVTCATEKILSHFNETQHNHSF